MRFLIFGLLFLLVSCASHKKVSLPEEAELDMDQFSYLLYDLDNQEIISSYNESKILVPASSFKILTGYAALEVLGYKKRFYTRIYTNGRIRSGVLEGDLIISGGGDPSLDYQDLFNIASFIRKKGIKKVTGKLLYHDSFFLKQPVINPDQPDASYNSGISALSLRHNSFMLKANSKESNSIIIPDLDYLDFRISRSDVEPEYIDEDKWLITKNRNYRLPVKKPSLFVAHIFQKILKFNKVEIQDKIAGIDQLPKTAKELVEYESENLIDILRGNLRYSTNQTSEMLLLHLANRLECSVLSMEDAANCMKKWYQEKYNHLNWEGLVWKNGSGLAMETQITVMHLVTILREMYEKTYGIDNGASLMAISGLNGTLRKNFEEQALNIWAKTGTMYYVSSIAGFLFTDEHRYAFAIIANKPDIRKELDIAHSEKDQKLYKEYLKLAKLFREEALDKQDELIKVWIHN